MKMIVGLGNPGVAYKHNRHNVGFQCLDMLAARHGLAFDVKRGKAVAAVGALQLAPAGAVRVALVKPQAFMNVSGPSVQALMQFYKIELADLLVLYDDLDLPLGAIRLRASGGSGGHNGMKSIIQSLGSSEFARLRIGIDRPPGRMDPAAYVLQDFSPQQEEVMAQTRPDVLDACEHWLAHDITSAMNLYNARGTVEQVS
ncbi:MAG: aminoacyl-tRNA hydrolase [Caldilineales bacterium]